MWGGPTDTSDRCTQLRGEDFAVKSFDEQIVAEPSFLEHMLVNQSLAGDLELDDRMKQLRVEWTRTTRKLTEV